MEKFNIDVLLHEIENLKAHGFYVIYLVDTWQNKIIIHMDYNHYKCCESIEDIHRLSTDQIHHSLYDRLLYMKSYLVKLEQADCNNA